MSPTPKYLSPCRLGSVFSFLLLTVLLTSCHLEVLDPIRNGLIAEFDYALSNQEGDVPIRVAFVNLSTEAISYRWDFGDGSVISTEFNPIHNYAKAGDYTVTLTAINELGEEDFISIPLTLTARKYIKEWPLGDDPEFIFTGMAPIGDSAYLFAGSGDLYPFYSVLTNLYGDTLSTTSYLPGIISGHVVINVPGTYLDFRYANSIGYEENGTVYTSSFSQPDLFLLGQYDGFGFPRHVAFETEGRNRELRQMYFASEGRRTFRPNLTNFFGGGFNNQWPVHLEQFCSLTGITISHEGGVAGIGFQSSDCSTGLRIEKFDSNGNQTSFQNLTIPPESESWKIVAGDPGQYVAIGNYPEEQQLSVYVMDADFNILSQNTIATEQEYFEIEEAKSGGDGSFFVVGETSSTSSQIKAFKVNNDGSLIWRQAYDFPTKVTSVNGIYPTDDCGLLIYGSYYAGFNADAPLIIKTDQDGLVE